MSAVISADGLYRYELWRDLGGDGPIIGWCLHNPSTADAEKDDATSRRGIGFSRMWGASQMAFVNLWAGRATEKADLWKMADPVGPGNDQHIAHVARKAFQTGGFVLLGWGAIADEHKWRAEGLKELFRQVGCPMRALGFTAAGHPRHPLYAANKTPLVEVP